MTARSSSPSARVDAVSAARVECTVNVRRIGDLRSYPSTLGTVAGRTVKAPADFDSWMRSNLRGLERSRIGVVFDADPAVVRRPSIEADFDLSTAWVASAATSKEANVVAILTYHAKDGDVTTRTYRGTASTVNWSSGDAEIQSMIDDAFSQLLQKAAVDIRDACSSRAVEPSRS